LAFRDYLRADPEQTQRYADLKLHARAMPPATGNATRSSSGSSLGVF
jgi:GrpB-like predicted nucleotidyltransferase (UPF0157 family)